MNISKRKSVLHSFFLMLAIFSLLLITACDDISAEDMENYPESVQDGTVSVKYYKQIEAFYEEDMPMVESIMSIVSSQIDMNGATLGGEDDIELREIIQSFNKRLDKYSSPSLSTKADEEIEFQFEKVIYMQEEINSFELDFLESRDFNQMEAVTLIGLMKNVLQDFDDVVDSYKIK